MKRNAVQKEIINVLVTLLAAALHALGLWVFIYPAEFAPSEISGVKGNFRWRKDDIIK